MRNRVLAFVCSLIIIIQLCIPLIAFATGPEYVSISIQGANPGTLKRGDTFTASIYFDGKGIINGLQSVQCELTYDPSILEVTDNKTAWEDADNQLLNASIAGKALYGVAVLSDIPIEGQICFFELTFKVKDDAAKGDTKINLVTSDLYQGKDNYGDSTPISQSLTITIPATGITISPETLKLAVGETDTLTATLEPTGAEGNIIWSSNVPDVATVDPDTGEVTAVSVGETTITATCGTLTDTCKVTVKPATISGTVTISGILTFDETLTAVVTEITPEAAQNSLTYQWYRGDTAISGATEKTYTLTADDINQTIKVAVTGTGNYEGMIEGTLSDTVGKATPDKPTINESEVVITDKAVTLPTISGALYAMSTSNDSTGVTWKDNPVFTSLDENTTYYFFAKLAETATHNESDVESISVTTKKTPRNVTVKIDPETTATENTAKCTYEEDNFGVDSTVTLTAAPGNDYTFTSWSADNPSVTIANASSTTASFTMPAADVTVTATFTKKSEVKVTWTYPKTQSPSFADGITVADLFSVEDEEAEEGNVIITYMKNNQSVDGTAEATAGSYVATYTYNSSSGSKYATTIKTSNAVIVEAATQDTPDPITGGTSTTDSITIDTVVGQAYIIREGTGTVTAEAFGEAESVAGTKTFSGLAPGTQYTVYTIKPAVEGKYQASEIVSATYTTKHTFDWTITPAGDITFFARTGASELPEGKTYTITNTGTGTLNDITISLGQTTSSDFTVTGPGETSLDKGEKTTFTIQPAQGTAMNTATKYEDTLTISAEKGTSGDGDGNGDAMDGVTRTVQFDVVDKHVVTISGLEDTYTFTYNGQSQGVSADGITGTPVTEEPNQPFDGTTLEIWYIGTSGTTYPESKTAPTNAGSYTVTVKVPDDDPNYMGQDTANLTIDPKLLTVTGLTADPRVYDGTVDVTLTGGALEGVIGEDDVSATMPTTGTYKSTDAESGKTVTFVEIALTGEDAPNYSLTQPTVTGEITKRPVEITITCADKEYDGTTAVDVNTLTSTLEGEGEGRGVLEADKDSITVTVSSATFADKNAGEDKQVTIGTVTTTGDAAKNYTFTSNETATADITPRKVKVTITGDATATYTGAVQKPHTATYTPVDGDTVAATVNYSPDNPVKAATYTLTATINDPNYELSTTDGVTSFEIELGTLTHQDVIINAKQETTKTVNVSQFDIAALAGSLAPTGTYALGTVTDDDAILNGKPTLENGVITFTMAANAEVGKTATIPVIYTPEEGTYEEVTANITITASELGFTTSLTGMPQSVKLGEELDLTNAKLVVTFDQDAGLEDLTIPVTANMVTGYDKEATGQGSIGNKTLTVTHTDIDSGRTYTATGTIQVLDVVTGIAFGAKPTVDQTQYTWSKDKAFKLEGVTIQPTMKSQVSAEPVSVTADMLSPDASILDQLGTHTITVTYEGQTVTFEIQVTQPKIEDITTPPAEGDAGVTDVGDDTTFEDKDKNPVDAEAISLIITEPKDKTGLEGTVEGSGAFNSVDSANRRLLRIQLEDQNGQEVDMQAGGTIQVQLPYPAGTTANDTFTVVVNVNGTATVITPDRTSGGLVLTLNPDTINQDLAIGWVPYTPPTTGGGTGGSSGGSWWSGGISYQEQQRRFWETVRDAIQKAAPGSTIRADAQSYDQMPAYVMRALYWADDITLVISWNGGIDLVIHSDSAAYPEDIRSYYPLSYLERVYGVNMPVLGDDYEGEIAAGRSQVMDVRAPVIPEDVQVAFTPADEGLLDVPVPVTVESETGPAVPTIPEVTVAVAANNTNVMGYVCLGLAGLLVLACGAVLILRRRKG